MGGISTGRLPAIVAFVGQARPPPLGARPFPSTSDSYLPKPPRPDPLSEPELRAEELSPRQRRQRNKQLHGPGKQPVMLWPPLRLPPSSRRLFGIARLGQHAFPRRFSHPGVSNPSIATLLATPPRGDAHTITAVGSVRTIRNQKQRSFVELGDGSTVHSLQALLEPAQAEGSVDSMARATCGSLTCSAEQTGHGHSGSDQGTMAASTKRQRTSLRAPS